MRPNAIVLDFDGTFTDVEREAEPFLKAYVAAIAAHCGRDVREEWAEHAARITREPDLHGWLYDGKIVAPAGADPYIGATTIAQELIDRGGAAAEKLFHDAYAHTTTAFRADARATLEAVIATEIPTYVVTNARTDVVTRKLESLAPRGLEKIRIVGNARKFALDAPRTVDARYAAVPETLEIPGLSRKVHPRRGSYFEALSRVWTETGSQPESTLVCGDIFELDLVLPIQLGASVHLVSGPRTPRYVLDAIDTLGPRGSHGDELGMVLKRLGR